MLCMAFRCPVKESIMFFRFKAREKWTSIFLSMLFIAYIVHYMCYLITIIWLMGGFIYWCIHWCHLLLYVYWSSYSSTFAQFLYFPGSFDKFNMGGVRWYLIIIGYCSAECFICCGSSEASFGMNNRHMHYDFATCNVILSNMWLPHLFYFAFFFRFY